MKPLLHSADLRQRLRPLRPYYNRFIRRQRDLSRDPAPADLLRGMEGKGLFLFSFGRSGTTVFCEFLASHPQLITFGEVLGEGSFHNFYSAFSHRTLRWWSMSPSLMEIEFYKFMARKTAGAKGLHCLFDLKIESLHMAEGNWRLPGHDFKIFRHILDSGAPVILMERRDLVARHLSAVLAGRRNQYHSYEKGAGRDIPPFEVDIAGMERSFAVIRGQMDWMKARFADHPRCLHVTYEDLFEPGETAGTTRFSPVLAARLAEMLGIENAFDTTPRLERVAPKDWSGVIRNLDAVEAARTRLLTTA